MTQHEDENKKMWEELAEVHIGTDRIARFRAGENTIDEIQLRELGDLKGKTLLHLQCHFGLDTLSLARHGAIVTGVDFSERAIESARRVSVETGIPAKFVYSNIYDIGDKLGEAFDIVYTTQGVLCWLRDLREWARIIERHLKSGGIFYLMETHPILNIFDDTNEGPLNIVHPYFHRDEPKLWDDNSPDYMDPTYRRKNPSYEWQWSLSDIINSQISAGLTIESFNEYDRGFDAAHPKMRRAPDGWWVIPELRGKLPLMYTIRARKNKGFAGTNPKFVD